LPSCLTCGINPPSANWLGHYAIRPEIGDTGQWNIDHVDDSYEAEFLQRLAQRVGQQ